MPESNIPQHIAIIMDGNGRWAKKRFMPRVLGHRAGVDTARKVVKYCAQKQIQVLTLFAFSSENWQRPEEEVNFLMELFLSSLENEVKSLHENNIQIRFIGNRSRFHSALCQKMIEVEQLTRNNAGLTLIIAIDYGGQWDITQSVQQIACDIEAHRITSADVTTKLIAEKLSFSDLPNPDLFIRTSGELRISNFMLWQLAYSELYFTDVLWPDFNENELDNALRHFAKRERRFGFSSEQLTDSLYA
jgi:undecaprenyl diphosphate synthase